MELEIDCNSVYAAAVTSDRLATLQALRNRLALDIDHTEDPRDVAPLALRLTDVLTQIDQIPDSQQVSAADEIAARRSARRRRPAANKTRSQRSG